MLSQTFRRLLHVTCNVTHLARSQASCWFFLRVHDADFNDIVFFPRMTRRDFVPLLQDTFLNTDQGYDSTVFVVSALLLACSTHPIGGVCVRRVK